MQYPKSFIKELYRSLAEEIADIIVAESTLETISVLAQKYKVDSSKLESEVNMVLMGINTPQSFSEQLEITLGVESTKAKEIVQEVKESIFSSISEEVLRAQQEYTQAKIKELPTELTDDGVSALSHVPEIAPEIHPEVLAGETVHDVPHVEPITPVAPMPAPNPSLKATEGTAEIKVEPPKVAPPQPGMHYPGGKDPYREPI